MSFQRKLAQDGFAFVGQVLSSNELQELEETIDEVILQCKQDHPELIHLDEDGEPTVISHLGKINYRLLSFSRIQKLRSLANIILGEESFPMLVEYFSCNQLGKGTPPHQDAAYYDLGSGYSAAFWLALDDAHEKNACMRYWKKFPSSLLEHHTSPQKGFNLQLVQPPSSSEFIPVPVFRGECIVHHCLTVHKSEPPVYSSCRRAIVVTYRVQ